MTDITELDSELLCHFEGAVRRKLAEDQPSPERIRAIMDAAREICGDQELANKLVGRIHDAS